jgi:RNA polymerase sigma factor (sigma-70 family)
MAARPEALLRPLRRLASRLAPEPDTDAALLARFARCRDEDALAALMSRYGRLVLGVCRRVLGDAHAAEDAAQATFLVLARKAGTLRRPEGLAGWLHGTACRIALTARRADARRRRREARSLGAAPRRRPSDPLEELTARDLLVAVDQELARLPERYRLPLILCCLEGQNHEEAAARLGWTAGSLRGRLARARARLHARLAWRGLTLPAALAALEVSRGGASAGLPAALARATARAALAFASHGAAGAGVPAEAAALAQGALNGGGGKGVVALLLAAGIAAAGAAGLAPRSPPDPPAEEKAPVGRPAPAADSRPATDRCGDPLPEGALGRLGTVRFREASAFTSLAYTPDGRTLVSGGGGAAFWDPATGKRLRRLGGDLGHAFGPVALSPDGKRVAVGSWSDKTGGSAIYEVATGRVVCRFGTISQNHMPACFSPDGRLLAVLNMHRYFDLFDAATGRLLHDLDGQQDVVDVAFTPDGKTLVSAGRDGAVRFWDPKTGRERRHFIASPTGVAAMALSPDGTRLATTDLVTVSQNGQRTLFASNRGRLWEAASGKELFGLSVPTSLKFEGRAQGGGRMAFSPDGKELWTGAGGGGLWVWDAATGKELRHFPGRGYLNALAFAPDGKKLATAEGGYCTHVRDRLSGRDLVPTGGHRGNICAVAAAADGRLVATGGDDGTVRLWDAAGRERRRLDGHGAIIFSLKFARWGRALVSAGADDTLRLWDVDSSRELRRFKGPTYPGWPEAVSPDGTCVAVAGREKGILLLDATTGEGLQPLQDAAQRVQGVSFTPDGRTLLAWGFDKRLHEWDVASGKHRARPCDGFGDGTGAVAFSPDGRLLALSGHEPFLILVDVATGQEVRRFEGLPTHILGNGIWGLAFSPDGRTLVWSSPSANVVWLGEVATGRQRAVLRGHGGGVDALAFTADGRSLVSGSNDTTALVWDLSGRLGGRPLSKPELEACWADLAGADAARAYRQLLALAGAPAEAVPFLKARLRPTTEADPRRVAGLLAGLGAGRYADRERAAGELARLGPAAEPALRRALAARPALETRRRIEGLLKGLDSPEQLRRLRAVEALERAGTPEARRLLGALAGGAPEARLTKEARASLDRLERRPEGSP